MMRTRLIPVLGVLLAAGVVASAGTISNVIFRIEASNAQGSGFLEYNSSELVYNPVTGAWDWSKGFVEILDNWGDTIAVLNSANMNIVSDPTPDKPYRINLGFAVGAGDSNTYFTIRTALLSFPTIPAAWLEPPAGGGRATASFTVTDQNGNGATMMGDDAPGIGAYTAQYNGFVPNGTTFANLVNLVQAGPGGSASGGQTMPGGTGYAPIGVDVSDMSVQADFMLTYGDAVSATTSYRILPEPASVMAVALAIVAAGLRRR